MPGVKGMQGGGGKREGSGRKTAEEKGIEKKQMRPAYLRNAQYEWLVKKFGSITAALESLLPKKLR